MTSTESSPRQPIGYWLKRLDELLTERMDQVLKDNELTRSHWQVLNLVHEDGLITRAALWGAMKSFVDDERLDDIINGLARRGWLSRPDGAESGASAIEITEDGRAGHAKVSELIRAFRASAREGISDEEYLAAIGVLARIATNLETSW